MADTIGGENVSLATEIVGGLGALAVERVRVARSALDDGVGELLGALVWTAPLKSGHLPGRRQLPSREW